MISFTLRSLSPPEQKIQFFTVYEMQPPYIEGNSSLQPIISVAKNTHELWNVILVPINSRTYSHHTHTHTVHNTSITQFYSSFIFYDTDLLSVDNCMTHICLYAYMYVCVCACMQTSRVNKLRKSILCKTFNVNIIISSNHPKVME
jgi:hypothetical protein